MPSFSMTDNGITKARNLWAKLIIAIVVAVLCGVFDGGRALKESYERSGATEEGIQSFEEAVHNFLNAAEGAGLRRVAAGRFQMEFDWLEDDPTYRAERAYNIDNKRQLVEEKARQIGGGFRNLDTAEAIFNFRVVAYNARFGESPFDLTPDQWRKAEADFKSEHPWFMRSLGVALQDAAFEKSAVFPRFPVLFTPPITFALVCSLFVLMWLLGWLFRRSWKFILDRVRDIARAARSE